MKNIIKFFLAFFFLVSVSNGQTTYLMDNVNVALTCPSTSLFYDSGGSAGNYANNENFTKTFSVPVGSCLQVSFSSAFQTESGFDRLRIYDGPNNASPLLGTYMGTTGPGIITSSGTSLTFSFTSDGSVVQAGWSATITCLNACSGSPAPGTASGAISSCGSSPTSTITLTTAGAAQACGISYYWQTAPAITGPWTNISGGTINPFTTTFTTTTYYRMRTQCNSSNSVYTNTITATSNSPTITCGLSTYVASNIAYSFDTFVGTVLPTTDDVLFATIINFGFPVCFAGSQYWGGYVASNSAFVLDAVPCFPNILTNTYAAGGVGTGYTIPNPAPVNNTSIPRNAILAPWQDIHPGLGGTIRYTTLGVAPNRRFVASWESIPMFSCGTNSPGIYYTGQVKIFETTNNIEIHVGNKGVCPGFNGGKAVMGLHSFDGTVYIPPVNATAHNSPTQWSMSNTAYLFSSPCINSGPCAVLPVNFKNFYGQQIEAANKLSWETALEENISEFIVERSTDAVNFKEIGRNLPYNQPSKYVFNDNTFKANIINYYRVTAVEKNGDKKRTNIIPIGGNYEELNVSEIFPNPIKDNFTLSFNSKVETEVNITIINMFGKKVKSSLNKLSVGVSKTQINVPELSSGIYIVEITDSNNGKVISQQKLIVVN
ncbi:MAG: T9SS type A sorting domain-containing protein [Bacteroidota bacterium]|nr:T9SS type A sorting domain-containing protein [Bacteroidota bacterium]MDP3147194.1 T9SS type A sorting domain-containing protein [Bacteroidota bacterium]